MLPNNQKEEIKYSLYYDSYHSYMRSSTEKRYTNIFIPQGTEMLVWYEHWQFNDDLSDFAHMWGKGEKTFYIPDGIARYDIHPANKDVTIPMVLMSNRNEEGIPESRIITEIYGGTWPVERDAHFGDIINEPEPYGLWVKMYKEPTYIPSLGVSIVAYGVFEENLPKVSECFKYGNYRHGIGGLTYKKATTYNVPITTNNQSIRLDPLSTKGQSIINQYTERGRLDSNGNLSLSWTCNICGMDTSYVEYDYLGSGTNHLQCELQNHMPLGLTL